MGTTLVNKAHAVFFALPTIALGGTMAILASRLLLSDELTSLIWAITIVTLVGLSLRRTTVIPEIFTRPNIVLISFLTVVSILLHSWGLDRYPGTLFVDEANTAVDAAMMLEKGVYPPYRTGWYQTPNFYLYFQAMLIKFFGTNELMLKLQSIIPASLLGACVFISVFGIYRSRGLALAAAILTLASRWHFGIARWGWNNLWIPVVGAIGFMFLVRGIQHSRRSEMMLSGILAAGGCYIYVGGRALVLISVLTISFAIISCYRQKEVMASRCKLALYFFSGFIVAISPLAVTWFQEPWTFLGRMQQISIMTEVRSTQSLQPLIDSVERYLSLFYLEGDPNGRHNVPGLAILSFPLQILLPISILILTFDALRNTASCALLCWFGVAMLSGILTQALDSPNAYRISLGIPALSIIAAVGLSRIIRLLSGRGSGLLLLASTLIAIAEVIPWLQGQYDHRSMRNAFNPDVTTIAREARRILHAGSPVAIGGHYWGENITRLLTWPAPVGDVSLSPSRFDQNDLERYLSKERNTKLLLPVSQTEIVRAIERIDPTAQVQPVMDTDMQLQAYTVSFPSPLTAPLSLPHGIQLSAYAGSDCSGQEQKLLASFVDFVWDHGQPIQSEQFCITVRGKLLIRASGIHSFFLQADDSASLRINENIIPGEASVSSELAFSLFLEKGCYPFEISYKQEGGGKSLAFYKQEPNETRRSAVYGAMPAECKNE